MSVFASLQIDRNSLIATDPSVSAEFFKNDKRALPFASDPIIKPFRGPWRSTVEFGRTFAFWFAVEFYHTHMNNAGWNPHAIISSAELFAEDASYVQTRTIRRAQISGAKCSSFSG